MAQQHWLDPLARQLLIATGQLPRPQRPPAERSQPLTTHGAASASDHDDGIERDLLALKLAREPGRRLSNAEEVRHAAALGWRLDVNRATAADWLRLPGCRAEQVDLLLRLQAGGVQLSGLEDLQRLLGLNETELFSWQPLLEFRWYGTAPAVANRCEPIAINQAGARELERLPAIEPELVSRLLRDRARRPFTDLADLQQRLQLRAELVEAWIGRVSFQPAPAGPVLPAANRPSP